jgi:hypothetical protein
MPAAIVRGASGAPGVVAYPSGLTTGIFNELNFVTPDWQPKLMAKYGNSSYMLIGEILGKGVIKEDLTTTNTFSHFEKGRSFGVGIVNANVTGITAGADVTAVLKSPESYNDGATGTQSPFNTGQTVTLRSNGRKAKVGTVTRTAGAFSIVFTPLGSYSFASGTSTTTLLALDAIEVIGGTQLAGESSSAQLTTQPKFYRYDNTCTVLRVGCKTSDLAGMNKTQIDFGGGNNYLGKLAVTNMNLQMIYSVENAIMEGVPYANTSSTGTIGVLPEVESRGSEVDYVIGAFGPSDFQRVTRVIDNNGGPEEYHFLQDLNQRQNINSTLFGIYPNGMINYGSVGFGQEAAVGYGFKSFSTDTCSFHFHRYKGFSAPSMYGYIPSTASGLCDFRADFGLGAPQGNTRDAKTDETMPYMQWVYQKNPEIPTAQKYYSWGMGYTQDTKTEEASNSFHQITYVGSRVVAAEQFIVVRGIAS